MAFPDVEQLVIAYLTPLMAPDRVASRVPDPKPSRFIQVRRIGGRSLQPVRDLARLDVFTWAATDPEAMALAQDVRLHMWALAGTDTLGPVVYEVDDFLAPRRADDEETGTPRVWATYELSIRADDVIHAAPSIIP